jgi:phosphoribosylformylglycinamidine cyclo-ligase
MGTRMEVYTEEAHAEKIITLANKFNVEAQVIGRVEGSEQKELVIIKGDVQLTY